MLFKQSYQFFAKRIDNTSKLFYIVTILKSRRLTIINKTYSLTLIALGAALVAALSPFQIPLGPIPITLQTLAIGLIATIYRPKEATLAILLYLLLGTIGLPVFASGKGGFQTFFGPTAGFLVFFPVRAFVTSIIAQGKQNAVRLFLANLLGEVVLFVGGVIGFILITHADFSKAINLVVLPFILPDLIKISFTTIFGLLLLKSLKNKLYFRQEA